MNPFEVLGLEPRFELEKSALEQRVRDLQKALHPDKHAKAGAAQRRMAMSRAVDVNDAYRTLRDEVKRAEALLSVLAEGETSEVAAAGGDAKAPAQSSDPEFLMLVMELREALMEARLSKDLAAIGALSERVTAMAKASKSTLADGFMAVQKAGAASRSDIGALGDELAKLRYYRRFMDEVALAEEDALG